MSKPKKNFSYIDFSKENFDKCGFFVKSLQLKSGAIPSNQDGTHDPWDHIESIMALNFIHDKDSSELGFEWLINNQNADGSWFSKYEDIYPLEKNKPTHFGPYIAVAALHFYKIYSDKTYLYYLWPTIESAINFSINIQNMKGTIPWSIDRKGNIENDYLLTGSSSILKSLECAIAISKILNQTKNISKWKKSYSLLKKAIIRPDGNFDLQKDRKKFSMDWYYPIISGCLDQTMNEFYVKKVFSDFYVNDIGVKCVKEEPWITVAESCEFIISLVISKKPKEAKRLLSDIINISDDDFIPYMGWQYKEKIFWPNEKPSWTSAALILAADTVNSYTKAADLFLKNQLDLY